MALTTTAIIPLSALTTPFRSTCSMARHFLPLLQPEPNMLRLTTGLTNGSRRPVMLIVLGASFLASAGFFLSATAILCFGCDFFTAAALGATLLVVAGLAVVALSAALGAGVAC